MDKGLIEKVAEAIYRHSGGLTDDECPVALGRPRRAWKTGTSWDRDPDNVLCEWERDEYRMQAVAALNVILSERSGVL